MSNTFFKLKQVRHLGVERTFRMLERFNWWVV